MMGPKLIVLPMGEELLSLMAPFRNFRLSSIFLEVATYFLALILSIVDTIKILKVIVSGVGKIPFVCSLLTKYVKFDMAFRAYVKMLGHNWSYYSTS